MKSLKALADKVRETEHVFGPLEELLAAIDTHANELARAQALAQGCIDALAAAQVENLTLREALGVGEPWPVADMLEKLATAALHLMKDHDCDHHGWEQAQGNIGRVRVAVRDLRAAVAPKPSTEALAKVRAAERERCAKAVEDAYERDEDVAATDVIRALGEGP